jgi:4,5-DOPA dioxygenase extradiol
LFVAHGAPMLLDDAGWMSELAAWGQALRKPKAILMLSAHWEARPAAIGATQTVPHVYDFYGFAPKYYQIQYPAPGAPWLAQRLKALLADAKLQAQDAPDRGLDHGAYIPLMAMYPEADVPVLQLSLPTMEPKALYALGRALAPLRQEGVLIVGSGFLTHNMRAFSQQTPAWASEFDAWAADTLSRGDVDALLDYRAKAPGVQMALPTHEHFVPVVVAAAAGEGASPSFPISGFWFGSFTRRSVQFG